LKLAHVAAQVGEESMVDQGLRDVVGASRELARLQFIDLRCGLDAGPERGGGVGQPEMHIAMISKSRKHEQMVGIEPGRAEYRHTLWEVAAFRLEPEPGRRGLEAFCRARYVKLVS